MQPRTPPNRPLTEREELTGYYNLMWTPITRNRGDYETAITNRERRIERLVNSKLPLTTNDIDDVLDDSQSLRP